MIIALDKNNQRISIEDAVKGTEYFCPSCGEQLIIRAKDSIAVRAHFAHKKGTDCDDFTHDMSEWHINWQKQFPVECREVVVENEAERHRADVLIKNTVIEFQHSPITADEIARRNKFYLSRGYGMIWVFDADNQIKNQYEDTLDPAKCREFDLCWKRAKRQFSIPMDNRVAVFIQYKTPVSVPELNGKAIDIMLMLKSIEPKDIRFFSTQVDNKYYYLQPQNFIKQFNENAGEGVVPFGAIIKAASEYQERLKQQQNSQFRYVHFSTRRGRRRF